MLHTPSIFTKTKRKASLAAQLAFIISISYQNSLESACPETSWYPQRDLISFVPLYSHCASKTLRCGLSSLPSFPLLLLMGPHLSFHPPPHPPMAAKGPSHPRRPI